MKKDTQKKLPTKYRRLIGAVVFVMIFILALTSLTYMIRTNGDTKTRFMGFYAEPRNSLDIVMIGSSPTYSSTVPAQLYGEYGVKAYPLASNVQRPIAGLYLVKEAEKTQSPKLYMFEMRMYVGIEEGLISNMAYTRDVTDNMRYSFNRIAAINAMTDGMAAENADPKYTYYFDIFKYHSNWKTLVLWDQITSFRYVRKDPEKGYKITDKVGPAETPVINADVDPMELDVHQEEALQNLLAYLKENDLDALFYVSPYELKEGDDAKYVQIKNEVEAAGYTFLDMNQYYDEIGIDFATDFSDYGIHTNAVGARKCTEFLGKYLAENYDLPDHRETDEKTDGSWEKAYENWQSEYSEAEETIEKRIEEEDWTVLEDQ